MRNLGNGFLSYDKASYRRGKVSCAHSQLHRFIAISHTDHIILSCPLNKHNVNNQKDCNQTAAGSDRYPQEKSDFSRTRQAQYLPVQSVFGTETQLLLDSGPMTASPCGSLSAVSTQPCRTARHPLVLFCCGWQPPCVSVLTPRLPPARSRARDTSLHKLLVPAGSCSAGRSRVPCPQARRCSPFPAAHFGTTFKAARGSPAAAPTPTQRTAHGPGGPRQLGRGKGARDGRLSIPRGCTRTFSPVHPLLPLSVGSVPVSSAWAPRPSEAGPRARPWLPAWPGPLRPTEGSACSVGTGWDPAGGHGARAGGDEEHERTAPMGGQLGGLELPQHPSPPAPWCRDGATRRGALVPTVSPLGTDSLCCWCCGETRLPHTLLSCAGK